MANSTHQGQWMPTPLSGLIVDQVLGHMRPPEGDEFVITGCERIRSTRVVNWNSRNYLETKSFSFALAGNGPILVGDDYTVEQAGTGRPVEHYVAGFEARRGVQ